MTNAATQTTPFARSAECQSPDHFAIEVEMPDGSVAWIDCTDVEPHHGPDEPSCPGGGLEDVGFTLAPEHTALHDVCREALLDALQGGC